MLSEFKDGFTKTKNKSNKKRLLKFLPVEILKLKTIKIKGFQSEGLFIITISVADNHNY